MIRVVVVDDHPIVRQGIASLLQLKADFELVGEAADGAEALRVILDTQPDVVLLDLRLPIFNGIEVMHQARQKGSGARFLVLTTYDSDEYISPALAAGAQGYLLKDAEPTALLNAIRTLVRGGAPLEASVAARLLERMTQQNADDALSAREIDVLNLLATGASNKAIAARLLVSENTIRSHVSHILEKLSAQSRGEAVAIGRRRGLIVEDAGL
jgi:DNA-binding NarL/FixJ family response regulator